MTVEKIYVSQCGLMELRLGDYREVLDDVMACESVITDPPYSERVHNGQTATRNDTMRDPDKTVTQLHYAHFSDEHVIASATGCPVQRFGVTMRALCRMGYCVQTYRSPSSRKPNEYRRIRRIKS